MPYIKQSQIESLQNGGSIQTAGELNYLLTMTAIDHHMWATGNLYDGLMKVIERYLEDIEPSYAVYNAVIGAVCCAQMEYVRRTKNTDADASFEGVKIDFYLNRVAPYEDTKIRENGDVYSLMLHNEM